MTVDEWRALIGKRSTTTMVWAKVAPGDDKDNGWVAVPIAKHHALKLLDDYGEQLHVVKYDDTMGPRVVIGTNGKRCQTTTDDDDDAAVAPVSPRECEHEWQIVAMEEPYARTPDQPRLYAVCLKCSSYSYYVVQWVGYMLGGANTRGYLYRENSSRCYSVDNGETWTRELPPEWMVEDVKYVRSDNDE